MQPHLEHAALHGHDWCQFKQVKPRSPTEQLKSYLAVLHALLTHMPASCKQSIILLPPTHMCALLFFVCASSPTGMFRSVRA